MVQKRIGEVAPVRAGDVSPSVNDAESSRRAFLGALFMTVAVLGNVSSSERGQNTPLRIEHSGQPQYIKVGAVALRHGTEQHLGDDSIRRMVEAHTRRIGHATGGQFELSAVGDGTPLEIQERPDSHIAVRGLTREAPAYSEHQVETAAAFGRRRFGPDTVPVVILDNDRSTLGDMSEGAAYGELGFACITPLAVNKTDSPDVAEKKRHKNLEGISLAHELLHILGLGHQAVFDAVKLDEGGRAQRLCMADSIQNLLAAGCDVQRHSDGTVDVYSSRVSVMGSLPMDMLTDRRDPLPIITSVERARLNTSLKVKRIDTRPGTYYLSYQPGETFAVSMDLPRHHALRFVSGFDIDRLFMGLDIVSYLGNIPGDTLPSLTDPYYRKTVRLYGTSELTRDTVYMRLGGRANVPMGDSSEGFMYADEQLNILITAGQAEGQSDGHFVRVRALDTDESQRLLARAREWSNKENEQRLQEYNA